MPGKHETHLDLNVTRRRVHQVLMQNKLIRYESREPVPKLLPRHISARLAFADKMKFWTDEFQNVIFSDEKKFNLDGPDGCHKYWRDVRQRRQTRHKRNHGGGSLMIWAAFGYAGKSPLCFIPTKTNAEIYVKLLDEVLIEFGEKLYGDSWIFQQDNAPTHNARITKEFFFIKKHNCFGVASDQPELKTN
uniref:Transposable element Tc3 transposase n=1 Tax=Bactrocera latifrons TaxID=174628 RepID=A0A0K8U0P5_BACLA